MEGTLTKKGKYWYVVVDIGKDSNGKRIRKWHNTNCKSKTEAKKVKRRILSSLDDGTYVEPKKISFSEFILEWLEDDIKVNREATTYESYKQTIKKHIVPFFYEYPITRAATHSRTKILQASFRQWFICQYCKTPSCKHS
jgi:hypothetical protein